MNDYETLNHTTWDCKYHIVFIPKRRRKVLYQELRRHLGEVFRQLAAQKESKIEEGHLLPDHVHMCFPFHRSMRCRKWSDTSKARARSIWPARTESESRIS
jgi:putative transposase